MVNLRTHAVFGLISVASALEVGLARWSQSGCTQMHHIGDGHVKMGHCKTFGEAEPLFYSFLIWPEKDAYDIENRLCQLTIYSKPNCEGQGFSFGDMQPNLDRCASIPTGGRSVFLSCASRINTNFDQQPPGTVVGPQGATSTILLPGVVTTETKVQTTVATSTVSATATVVKVQAPYASQSVSTSTIIVEVATPAVEM